MNEANRDLFGEFQRSQVQIIYFVLGVAASAIAFAIHQTDGRPLSFYLIPIGGGVLLWSASFVAGLLALQSRQEQLRLNYQNNSARDDATAGQFINSPEVKAILDEQMAELRRNASLVLTFATAQRWLLFVGALAYLGGHVWRMALVAPLP